MRKRISPKLFENKKRVWIIGGIGILVLLILIFNLFGGGGQGNKAAEGPTVSKVIKGQLASSTLLTGMVKAQSEQYVYFDNTIGRNATVTVSAGEEVSAGQQLVQYDSTSAQAAYDIASRAYNKAIRDRNYFQQYGTAPTASAQTSEDTDKDDSTAAVTAQQRQQTEASNYQTLQDYNDAVANAASELEKAQDVLNQTVIVSDVNGTVVEVADSVDPASKESQTLVHVTSEGQFEIQGTLTEYDMPNISVGQKVKITSKVYPDQTWTGKVNYISNYPKQNASQSANASGNSGQTGSQYEYKVQLTSPIGKLKQGFNVSLEVTKDEDALLVPVTAVTKKGSDNYVWVYDEDSQKIKQVKVKLGNADAKQQEIASGLKEGQKVITKADKSFKDGETLKNVTDAKGKKSKDTSGEEVRSSD